MEARIAECYKLNTKGVEELTKGIAKLKTLISQQSPINKLTYSNEYHAGCI